MVLIKASELRPAVSRSKAVQDAMVPAALMEIPADTNPDLVEFRPAGFDIGSAELIFADGVCQQVHALRVVAV